MGAIAFVQAPISISGEEPVGGRYELAERVGEGNFAVTYRARDLVLGRTVAVKMLRAQYAADPTFVARFEREARVAASVSHPNVVDVYDFGAYRGTYFIAMQYVPGRTLKDELEARGPFPAADAVRTAGQILHGLAAIHAAGIVHRDIKPQNVLLGPDRVARVTDFGVAHYPVQGALTTHGTTVGTASYMAPEQARGAALSEATDLYAVGVVLFELLTGRLPFEGDNPMAVMLAHLQQPAPRPSEVLPTADIPPALEAEVMRALAKDARERRPSADEMAGALDASLPDGRYADARPMGRADTGTGTIRVPVATEARFPIAATAGSASPPPPVAGTPAAGPPRHLTVATLPPIASRRRPAAWLAPVAIFAAALAALGGIAASRTGLPGFGRGGAEPTGVAIVAGGEPTVAAVAAVGEPTEPPTLPTASAVAPTMIVIAPVGLPTAVSTDEPTATPRPQPTVGATATPRATSVPTPTVTPPPPPTATATTPPAPTVPPRPSATPTETPAPTATPSPEATATATATATEPVPSPTGETVQVFPNPGGVVAGPLPPAVEPDAPRSVESAPEAPTPTPTAVPIEQEVETLGVPAGPGVVSFSAQDWRGGTNVNAAAYGRAAVAIYGVDSTSPSATLAFTLERQPAERMDLWLLGLGDESGTPFPFAIRVNDFEFTIPESFPNWTVGVDGEQGENAAWGVMRIQIPPNALRAGNNQIAVVSRQAGATMNAPPYILLAEAALVPSGDPVTEGTGAPTAAVRLGNVRSEERGRPIVAAPTVAPEGRRAAEENERGAKSNRGRGNGGEDKKGDG